MKFVPQQANNATNSDPNTPSPQAANDNKSLDDIRRSSIANKADVFSSLHSGSSHHVTSVPPTPQVFVCTFISMIVL